MVEGKVGLCVQIYTIRIGVRCYRKLEGRTRIAGICPSGIRTHLSIPCGLRRHDCKVRDAFRLPDAFVVSKKECLVLENRSAYGSAKLIPFERWDLSHVEVVPGVEAAVAKELVRTAVKLIGPGSSNGIYHSPGGLAIFRRVVAGQYGKFLNGVHAQVPSQHTAGSPIGVVVEADAIQTVIVLLRSSAGNGQLLTETAIASIGSG